VGCWCKEDEDGLHFGVRYIQVEDTWLSLWTVPLRRDLTKGFFEKKRVILSREASFKDNHQLPPIKGGIGHPCVLKISVNQGKSTDDLIKDIIDIYKASSNILEYGSKKTYPKI
jgi:hypothetical protein